MKRIRGVLLILVLIISGTLFSKEPSSLWVVGNIGTANIMGDIGGSISGSMNEYNYGVNGGVQLIKKYDTGFNIGVDYSYSHVISSDEGTEFESRGFFANSKINELGVLVSYNLLRIFTKEDFPLQYNVGIMLNGVYSHVVEFNERTEGSVYDDGFPIVDEVQTDPILSILPCIISDLILNIDRISFGLSSRLGYSSTDYLDGVSPAYNSFNDYLTTFTFNVGYKIK